VRDAPEIERLQVFQRGRNDGRDATVLTTDNADATDTAK
jgi:hypothetical protein